MVNVVGSTYQLFMQDALKFPSLAAGATSNRVSTSFTVTSHPWVWTFTGTGFTYSGTEPTGGTITGLSLAESGVTFLTITAGSINLATAMTHINNGNQTGFYNLIFGGHDTITGTSLNDDLEGFGGNDTLNGGDGNDTLRSASGTGVDTIDGGNGTDLVSISRSSTAGWTYTLANFMTSTGASLPDGTVIRNVEEFAISTSTGNDTLVIGGDFLQSSGFAHFWAGGGTDTVIADFSTSAIEVRLEATDVGGGTPFFVNLRGMELQGVEQFQITGSTTVDYLTGGAGNDILDGAGGDDNIAGGGGVNTLRGGAGADAITTSSAGDTVDGGDGSDAIRFERGSSSASFTLIGSEAASAQGATLADGTVIRNVERLHAITFGSGNDFVHYTPTSQFGVAYGGGGSDRLSVDFSAADNEVRLRYSDFNGLEDRVWITGPIGVSVTYDDFEHFSVIGGAFNDRLYGDAGDDVLSGGGGNDVIQGGIGNDVINGGAGDDLLLAYQDLPDTGLDTLTYADASAGVTVTLKNPGNSQNTVGSGVDIIGDGFDTLVGSTHNDILTGSYGVNTINGGAGDDTLDGWLENDVLFGGLGIDTSIYTGASTGASWHRNPDGSWTVNAGADGTDTVSTLEYLDFTDRDVFLDRAYSTFSGDGTSDVFMQHANGSMSLRFVNASGVTGNQALATALDGTWDLKGVGDFDGDSKDDVLIWHDSGFLAGWFMNGATIANAAGFGGVSKADWDIDGIGDINGDGKDDIIIWHDSGFVGAWLMNGSQATGLGLAALDKAVWDIEGLADFNGDGTDDILWRNTDGNMGLWFMNDGQATGVGLGNVGHDWAIEGLGDFNGDGRDDILLRHDSGWTGMWLMDGSNATAVGIGTIGHDFAVAAVGDYNGDGRDDILWWNDNGNLAAWFMNGAAATSASYGTVSHDWVINPG